MPVRRHHNASFPDWLTSDEDLHRLIEYQKQSDVECPHNIEFWVAVSATRRDGACVVMQWCMACRAIEVLSLEEYQVRQAVREAFETA